MSGETEIRHHTRCLGLGPLRGTTSLVHFTYSTLGVAPPPTVRANYGSRDALTAGKGWARWIHMREDLLRYPLYFSAPPSGVRDR